MVRQVVPVSDWTQAALDAREIEEVADDAVEPPRLLLDGLCEPCRSSSVQTTSCCRRLPADAMIDARGVRRSCDTASMSADFSSFVRRSTSASIDSRRRRSRSTARPSCVETALKRRLSTPRNPRPPDRRTREIVPTASSPSRRARPWRGIGQWDRLASPAVARLAGRRWFDFDHNQGDWSRSVGARQPASACPMSDRSSAEPRRRAPQRRALARRPPGPAALTRSQLAVTTAVARNSSSATHSSIRHGQRVAARRKTS